MVSPPQPAGSPFVPGQPLEAHQRLFGRDEVLQLSANQVCSSQFGSVNLVGERRMGKTSVLNHLLGRRAQLFPTTDGQPPYVVVAWNMQDGVTSAERFYGRALAEVLAQLNLPEPQLQQLQQRFWAEPRATGDEFRQVLQFLKEQKLARPVLLVDEFEQVFEPHLKAAFPFPDFFNGLRAHIEANRVALLLFTRANLLSYFQRQSLTSSFPSYFTIVPLGELTQEDAESLLLQPSDRRLTSEEMQEALSWAGLHPSRLQCAGQAWYEAKWLGKSARWARERYDQIAPGHAFVNPAHHALVSRAGLWHRLRQPSSWLLLGLLGAVVALKWYGKLGATVVWCKENIWPLAVISVVLLLFAGKVKPEQVWKALSERVLGGDKEEKKDK